MTKFNVPVRDYMVVPVFSIHPTHTLSEAEQKMAEWGISALPVEDVSGKPIGVLSRTDVLRAGRVRIETNGSRKKVLMLPDAKVREFMTNTVEVIAPDTPLSEAAKRMARMRIHRLYVVEDGRMQGVISTQEVMQAVADANVRIPLAELMSGGIVTVKAADPLSLAIDRLAAAKHSALVVVEDKWPVGIFSQGEALASRDAPAVQPVSEWMDTRILCLPTGIPAGRAAQQAISTGVRTILAVDAEHVRGVVSGADFAQLISS